MARDTGSITKRSRREGYALHPKAARIMTRRTTLPGESPGKYKRKGSQYSIQLREKQKVKRIYGLLEKQFSNLMKEAGKSKGRSGETLIILLERRLDNVVYRAGLSNSRRSARQLVSHGHIKLNGKRVNVPSIRINPGDKVEVTDKGKKNGYFSNLEVLTADNEQANHSWMNADLKKMTVDVTGLPTREEAEPDINEQLIVEYYSR